MRTSKKLLDRVHELEKQVAALKTKVNDVVDGPISGSELAGRVSKMRGHFFHMFGVLSNGELTELWNFWISNPESSEIFEEALERAMND